MSEIGYEGPPPIDSYGGGGFRVSGVLHQGDMLLLGPRPEPWTPGAMDESVFAAVLARAGDIDVLLVGMGGEIAALPSATRGAFDEAGIGVEVMSTASACRTYNVLLAEDRRVAAALIAI